ncbi:MAG: hypothetical protein IJU92_09865 [Spirochaetaceae bacterium]|nr:hypothetical protein [Spirochaetaceae bacterium]
MRKIHISMALVVIMLLGACKTPSPVVQPIERVPEPFIETSQPPENTNRDRIEGTYIASFLPSSMTSGQEVIYTVQFFQDKTARLLIFKGTSENPSIFRGKWLETKEHIIILYFENSVLSSEFFKKRADGNLSILRANRTEYTGDLYDYMVAEKIE